MLQPKCFLGMALPPVKMYSINHAWKPVISSWWVQFMILTNRNNNNYYYFWTKNWYALYYIKHKRRHCLLWYKVQEDSNLPRRWKFWTSSLLVQAPVSKMSQWDLSPKKSPLRGGQSWFPSLSLEVGFAQPLITRAGPHFRHFSTLVNCIIYTSRKRKKKTKGKTTLPKPLTLFQMSIKRTN